MEKKVIIDSSLNNSTLLLRDTLYNYLLPIVKSKRTIILLCIGSDRSTGDSLGPLVGHKLRFLSRDNFYIYGSLESPVHAKNLKDIIKEINQKFKNPYIIAVDACLGSIQNIGNICVEEKPLSPGSAMNKKLPPVGNLSITGIVNISGALEFMVLQNTRLHTVITLADIISNGIYHSVLKTIGGRRLERPIKKAAISR
ncbi:spore protease YyaC [Clostridium lundense]|uniref:spore protease YyaC n=1 Tax=Clostridium lundense TaxID=319475 RepID=UPI0004858DE9|nr:spore protease YyaC [Clostridium lundense]